MLTELRIRNVGVIEDVTLELAAGLNVLTGETGAGKTMVVSALELLLGGRADADRVRAGAGTAVVEGRLVPAPAAAAAWLDDGDDELVIAREVVGDGAGGRSRARVGGRMAPASALAASVGAVIELHGQSDTVRLAQPAVQRDLLDRFGGAALAAAGTAYRAVHARWRAATDELATLRASERERVRELDRIRYELAEIDAVGPEPGEQVALDGELRRLEHAAALTAGAAAAAAAISEDGGARDALGAAVAALRPLTGVDAELDAVAARVEALATEAQDAGLELAGYADGLDVDPQRLDALRERSADLARLTRKYGEGPAGSLDPGAVAAYAAGARQRLVVLAGGDERAAALHGEVERLRGEVARTADVLRHHRLDAAQRLVESAGGHLDDLGMSGARLHVAVEPVEPGPTGADRVAFELAANRGQPPLPLGKAASGGERSRVALALRLALADADDTPVLVFDEVDAGIGGATALAVGRKLAQLARGRQVLCVTHLAQLASFADAHFLVTKGSASSAADSRTVAAVRRLDEGDRVTELSRMLSGSPDSAVAVRHAAALRAAAAAAVAAFADG